MSAAAVSVQQPRPLELVHDSTTIQAQLAPGQFKDDYPLLPVFIAGVIALAGAFAFVGGIVALISLRYSGVLAP